MWCWLLHRLLKVKSLSSTRTSLLVGARPPALAPERGSPLAAESGVLLDHRPAAPVPTEARVEMEDPGRLVPVPVPSAPHLDGELRHGVRGDPPRRAHHRDVRPQPEAAGQREGIPRATELRAGQRHERRAPRRRRVGTAANRGRRRGAGEEGLAEEAAPWAERSDGRGVERRRRVERPDVDPRDGVADEPVVVVVGRRGVGVGVGGCGDGDRGGHDEADRGVEREGGDGEERGEGEEHEQRPEAAAAAAAGGGAARAAHVGFVGVWIAGGGGESDEGKKGCASFGIFRGFKRGRDGGERRDVGWLLG